jgi:hypothetical protein
MLFKGKEQTKHSLIHDNDECYMYGLNGARL